ncbi:hypothetical protein SAMN05216518_11438 [Bacteroidales bacterium KHT7]|nr:hypothetical protein SAMN05216518_11438 [Bacteroidales bacterium KHT7]
MFFLFLLIFSPDFSFFIGHFLLLRACVCGLCWSFDCKKNVFAKMENWCD